MISGYKNNLIAISNKLFAISFLRMYYCEVYDSVCKTFVALKSEFAFFNGHQALSVGRTILIFKELSKGVSIYDVDKNEWSEESFKVTKNTWKFHCLKIPSLKF